MLKGLKIVVVLVLGSVNCVAMAQSSTQPATTSAPARHAVVIPPGFNKITISDHIALVEPADEAWARKSLETMTPTTKPTTMPSTIRDTLQSNKNQLTARMMKDLAMTDPAPINTLLNEKLPMALKKLDEVSPPIFYLLTTEARVKDLMKGGWSDPRLRYNRLADKVDVGYATLSASGDADDVLSPVFFLPGDTPESKGRQLVDRIHDSESKVALLISEQAIIGTDLGLSTFIIDQVFSPLKLPHDQEWIGIGIAGVLSARYAATLTGMSEQLLNQFNSADNPRNPIRPATVDLIHPIDLSTMRREAMGAYADAYQRKSVRVMMSWVTRAGDEAIPKLVTELRKGAPADVAALMQKIQQISNVDISGDVGAGK